MGRIEYKDFKIEIEEAKEGGFRTKVIESPCGRGRGEFEPPWGTGAAERSMQELEGIVRGSEIELPESSELRDFILEDDDRQITSQELAIRFGSRLWRALFSGQIGDLFARSLEMVAGGGLRIRIVLWPDQGKFPLLAALPWELLYWPEGNRFLSCGIETPVVLELNATVRRRRKIRGPLKVLVVGPQPRGMGALDLERERGAIEEALGSLAGVSLVSADTATVGGFRAAVREEEPHVVHFMGHGGFDALSGAGLMFETEQGESRLTRAAELANNLRVPGLELIFLNACNSAALPRANGLDPYSGVATGLAGDGHMAVVAMQFPISDRAAGAFSRAFYKALAAKDPIDTAVSEARLAVQNELGPESLEWATPVLFMRTEDGELGWGDGEASSPEAVVDVPRLGIRSFRHPHDPMEETTDPGRILDLVRCFEGREIRPSAGASGSRPVVSVWEPVLGELREFVGEQFYREAEVGLQLDAHSSVALGTGWLLGSKAGVSVTVRQRTPWGVKEWPMAPAAAGEELWSVEDFRELSGAGRDVAVAISISQVVLPDVLEYVAGAAQASVGRLLDLRVADPSTTSLRSGAHALRLAQRVSLMLKNRTAAEREGTLHVFAAAPNAFMFALGREARGFGRIQLYEYDFESSRLGSYEPSILLDAAESKSPAARSEE